MPSTQTVLSVFLASPSDVAQERQVAEQVIEEINSLLSQTHKVRFELIRWETHAYPAAGDDPQQIINSQTGNDFDVFVGILWHRVGSPTPRAASGTLEEYERAKRRHDDAPEAVSVLMYFKQEPVDPSTIDPGQLFQVHEFKKTLGGEGVLYWTFSTTEQFEKFLRLHLTRVLQKFSASGSAVRVPNAKLEPTALAVVDDAKTLNGDVEPEVGFLDLLDKYEESLGRMGEALSRIGEATVQVGKQMEVLTAEMDEIKSASDSSVARSIWKRIMTSASEGLNKYVDRVNVELPIIHAGFKEGMDAMIGAVQISSDFTVTDERQEELRKLHANGQTFADTITDSIGNVNSFSAVVRKWPRMTSELNEAKRRTIKACDDLVIEFESGVKLIGEAQSVIEEVLKETPVTESQTATDPHP